MMTILTTNKQTKQTNNECFGPDKTVLTLTLTYVLCETNLVMGTHLPPIGPKKNLQTYCGRFDLSCTFVMFSNQCLM